MSLQRLAMLAALSLHNQQHSQQQDKYNNNSANNNQTTATTTTTDAAAAVAFTNATMIPNKKSATVAEVYGEYADKSDLMNEQQQDRLEEKLLYATTIKPMTIAATAITQAIKSISNNSNQGTPLATNSKSQIKSNSNTIIYSNDLTTAATATTKYNNNNNNSSNSGSNGVASSSSSNKLSNSGSAGGGGGAGGGGTTYYGSGFGVFHTTTATGSSSASSSRNSNNGGAGGGGGIALITGNNGGNIVYGSGLGSNSYANGFGINNNVNLLLGGAMLTLITTILCVVCYCCHRNIKKRTEAAYRQQRQWLENDPNMEIYSVEQCYETSGLFVGDSMDGLATIPTLHHEPPPSYDAVVAMQEQQQILLQQQQLLLQQQQQQHHLLPRNSPPPGYRSSLDVSFVQGRAGANLMLATIETGRNTAGLLATSVSMEGANALVPSATPSSTGSSAVSCASTSSNVLNYRPIANSVALATFSDGTQQQQQHDMNGNMEAMTTALAATAHLRSKALRQHLPTSQNLATFNMKKVLQAQSCCSLQRAEVENMWNAAAAALANRSNYNSNASNNNGGNASSGTVAATSSPTLIMANRRKLSNVACHSATPATARKSKNSSPTLTLSGTSTATALAMQSSGAAETFGSRYLKQQQSYYRKGCPLCGKFRYDQDNISSTLSISIESDLEDAANEEQLASGQKKYVKEQADQKLENNNEDSMQQQETEDEENEEEEEEEDEEEEEEACSCLKGKQQQRKHSTAKLRSSKKTYQKLNTGELENNNNVSVENLRATNESAQINSNENQNHINNNNMEQPTTSAAAAETAATTNNATKMPSSPSSIKSISNVNLDCINDNGLISLDMSKIIDKTGLPTYDAAIKLESSGYV